MSKEKKLIRNWEELSQVLPNNKYKIEIEDCCGWILPTTETEETEKDYFEHHVYLSTHTFYGKNKDGTGIDSYKESTKLLQRYGFDIEIDNWDKRGESDE